MFNHYYPTPCPLPARRPETTTRLSLFRAPIAALGAALILAACSSQALDRGAAVQVYASTSSGLFAFDGSAWNGSTESDRYPSEAEPSRGGPRFSHGGFRYVAEGSSLGVYAAKVLKQSYEARSIVADSSRVDCVLVDASSNILVGTDAGLAILYPGASSFVSLLPERAEVFGLCVDAKGYIFAASSLGLYKIGVGPALILAEGPLYCVYADEASGSIFAGGDSGIRTSANGGESWSSSLAGSRVYAIGK